MTKRKTSTKSSSTAKRRTKGQTLSSTKKRVKKVESKVLCKCKVCNGRKLINLRTSKKHLKEEKRLEDYCYDLKENKYKRNDESTQIHPSDSNHQFKYTSVEIQLSDLGPSQEIHEYDHTLMIENQESDEEDLVVLRKTRRRYDRFHKAEDDVGIIPNIPNEERDEEGSQSFDDDSVGDEEGSQLFDCDSVSDEEGSQLFDGESTSDDNGDYDEMLPDNDEMFAAPSSANIDYDSDHNDMNMDMNADIWILLWIFKYQERFRISDVAINSLIGFFSLVLKDVDAYRFKDFPSTAYKAKKLLEINKKTKTFATCPSCNKLYDIKSIIPENQDDDAESGFKCTHIEFPNHPMQSQRKSCEAELLKKVPVNYGYIWRPKMVYSLPCLKAQLTTMYQRPGFEESLQKWTNRNVVGVMSDIYDGQLWKTFPSSLDDPDSRFFTPETADSNLGIMINLDWFQPFDSSVYSTGVIYGIICNLPREMRFKKENMLTLGLLPGPHEVKLHRINHFLAPIVDELLNFWDGVRLPINKYPDGKKIRLAIICCSNDIPAARKLCGHISALVGCHRCHKRARGEEGQRPNFGGFDDINEWFRPKNVRKHRRNAMIWKHQQTNEDRKNHVRRTHVRWSEMLRLPYFDPIRYLVVDPMHNLFLGIAHWIVKRLWIDNGKITKSDLELMEKRAKKIKIPADLGRLPYKIATGKGFSGFTADQWKMFIMVYAIPIMWDLLDGNDQQILANFVRVCYLLVSRIIDEDRLNEAHNRLLEVARLIEDNYGSAMITPNIHLSLHISECCRDYGPIYSFWCYSFERMNGILGNLFIINLINFNTFKMNANF